MEALGVEALLQQFRSEQRKTSQVKLSERVWIDVVRKLIERRQIDVVFSQDGKQVLTIERLCAEIAEHVEASGGRINVVQLPALLGVDPEPIERVMTQLLRQNPTWAKENGELITDAFLDRVARESAVLAEQRGRVQMSELAHQFALSIEYLSKVLRTRAHVLGDRVQLKDDYLTTSKFLQRHAAIVRGALRGCVAPTNLSSLVHEHGLVSDMASKDIAASLKAGGASGRMERQVFLPDAYQQQQAEQLRASLLATGYIEPAMFARLGIDNAQAYCKRMFPDANDGVWLANCFASEACAQQVDSMAQHALQSAQVADMLEWLPAGCTSDDLAALLRAFQPQLRSVRSEGAQIVGGRFFVPAKWMSAARDLLVSQVSATFASATAEFERRESVAQAAAAAASATGAAPATPTSQMSSMRRTGGKEDAVGSDAGGGKEDADDDWSTGPSKSKKKAPARKNALTATSAGSGKASAASSATNSSAAPLPAPAVRPRFADVKVATMAGWLTSARALACPEPLASAVASLHRSELEVKWKELESSHASAKAAAGGRGAVGGDAGASAAAGSQAAAAAAAAVTSSLPSAVQLRDDVQRQHRLLLALRAGVDGLKSDVAGLERWLVAKHGASLGRALLLLAAQVFECVPSGLSHAEDLSVPQQTAILTALPQHAGAALRAVFKALGSALRVAELVPHVLEAGIACELSLSETLVRREASEVLAAWRRSLEQQLAAASAAPEERVRLSVLVCHARAGAVLDCAGRHVKDLLVALRAPDATTERMREWTGLFAELLKASAAGSAATAVERDELGERLRALTDTLCSDIASLAP